MLRNFYMFESFFPKPKWFLFSSILWSAISIIVWYLVGDDLASFIGFQFNNQPAESLIGMDYLGSHRFTWFYIYFIVSAFLFYSFWTVVSPHPWTKWSILGAAGIILLSYCYVQYSVAFNNWMGPYYDLVQQALTTDKKVELSDFYSLIFSGLEIFVYGCVVFAVNRFLISHFIFRWRTAMTKYYVTHWSKVRHIEGASQRVQEDTMKFARIMEGVGVVIIEAFMTLIAFVPVLVALSKHVTELPLVGVIPFPLCSAAFFWGLFGTLSLGVLGIKLPGLEYENQKVEAAYRKELVYGEDDSERAQVSTLENLYTDIKKNYYRLYLHYSYFNLGRQSLIYLSWIFTLFLLAPTIVASVITFGIFGQIRLAFFEVTSSLQCLMRAWPEIIDALSIYKRLWHFEQAIEKYKDKDNLPSSSQIESIPSV